MLIIILFFIAHWYLALFSQTFFQHRYAAHRAFTMNRFWEKVFFIFSYVTQGASYMSPKAYGIMHRLHHAYADTEQDPHSPSYDKNIVAMMWRTKKTYTGILYGKIKVEDKFIKNLPDWRWFDLMGNNYVSRLIWVGLYVWFYVTFAPYWWLFLLLPIHFGMGAIHGVIINWFAHKYGDVNFDMDNTSKNLFKVDLLMMGEGYHNNHHKHPSRRNFAAKRGEFDLCYPAIRLMEKFRIISVAGATAPATV